MALPGLGSHKPIRLHKQMLRVAAALAELLFWSTQVLVQRGWVQLLLQQ
jgi:hypothetical protein